MTEERRVRMFNRVMTGFLVLMVMVAAFAYISTAAKAQDIKQGLVLHLPFDEGSGTPQDMSDDPTEVSIEGKLEWVQGRFGRALEFDGDTENFVEVAHSDKLVGMKALTIAVWVNPIDIDALARGILSKREIANVDDAYNLFSRDMKFYGRVNILSGAVQTISDTLVEDQKWFHVVYVFDGNAKGAERLKMYINGDLEKTESHPDDVVIDGKSSLYVGTFNVGYAQNWHGAIDEVSIWSRALGEAEIQKLVQEPIPVAVQPQGKASLTWGRAKSETDL